MLLIVLEEIECICVEAETILELACIRFGSEAKFVVCGI